MKVPAFADIGKNATDLLTGKNSSAFQYDKRVTMTLKTPEAMIAEMRTVLKGDKPESDFKLKYVKNVGQTAVTLEGQPALKKATVTLKHPVIEGLKMSLVAGVPGTIKTAKMTAEYAQPHLTTKATMGLTASPVVDVSGAAGYEGFVIGGAARVGVRDQSVSNILLAASYMGKDFVASAHTDSTFATVRGTYWQLLDAASSVAAEVTHDTAASKVSLIMGYSHVDPDSGTEHKVKLANDAAVHLHRKARIRADTMVGVSLLFNALSLSDDPKLGIHIEHAP